MAKIFNQVKSLTLYYIVEDSSAPEVVYVAGPYSDYDTALDFCIELAHSTNKKNLEVYSQEIFVK